MHHHAALVGVALLNNLASGFSSPTSISLPTQMAMFQRVGDSSVNNNALFQTKQQQMFSTAAAHQSSSLAVRGGALGASTAIGSSSDNGGSVEKDLNLSVGNVLASLWGASGVAYILIKAIVRVLPIALEPFSKAEGIVPLTNFQLSAYILTCLFFAYAEGYKGFQLKFSPLVVARSFTIQPKSSPIHHLLLAPLYSMGLFHATKKRMIVSWCVTIGVATIVAAVKRMPYPWRNIVDAGVVVGLSWGTISILGGYIISLLTGIAPIGVDPAMPEKKE
mmetsp:Transcript_22801/g.35726  ORF Transcript_22801/g.35726 Transcript_22801/m.35726 type:complete len:277 (+) Transcript_22801:141-971(+)|eukprot:CAMPEP_0201732464 /NCGR_PEP_ID=MMETSP0593-20130828/28931_1 /ASSEMBLY_ACC=CAM_ASM_000672 /TAXON_ID=267983 /ORGANISM="Skeletonema japonicum, Strain CCMP2506" /LENGTH=276 /DNA_ID=CAMNT_0048225435 /DNA_START=83 /DNA_END=913 /DNA_ORIENTATION=-